jgi:hypothetical protein
MHLLVQQRVTKVRNIEECKCVHGSFFSEYIFKGIHLFKLLFFSQNFPNLIWPCLAGEECTDIEDPIKDAGKGVWNASRVEFGANGREVSLQQR